MSGRRTTFNYVGLCVADREWSRRFHEGLLGFQVWWEIEPPDDRTSQLPQLPELLGVQATCLVRDAFVLGLMDCSERDVKSGQSPTWIRWADSYLVFEV